MLFECVHAMRLIREMHAALSSTNPHATYDDALNALIGTCGVQDDGTDTSCIHSTSDKRWTCPLIADASQRVRPVLLA